MADQPNLLFVHVDNLGFVELSRPGRCPTDEGFEEWYGSPRTYDQSLWPTDVPRSPGKGVATR